MLAGRKSTPPETEWIWVEDKRSKDGSENGTIRIRSGLNTSKFWSMRVIGVQLDERETTDGLLKRKGGWTNKGLICVEKGGKATD